MAVEEAGAWLTRLGCNEDSMKKKKKTRFLSTALCVQCALHPGCTCCQWVSLKEEALVPHPSYSTEDSL